MRKIANILTDGLFNNDGLYNVVKEQSDLIDGIPTLVIGWEKTKKLFPNTSIIEWKINENTYWTWGNRERRDVQERDLKKFRRIAIKQLSQTIKYVFFNIMTANKRTVEKYISYLMDEKEKYVYIYNDMVYVYCPENNNIVGVSLADIDYMGQDRKPFFRALYGGKNNHIIKDEIPYNIKNEFKNRSYIFSYLYSNYTEYVRQETL